MGFALVVMARVRPGSMLALLFRTVVLSGELGIRAKPVPVVPGIWRRWRWRRASSGMLGGWGFCCCCCCRGWSWRAVEESGVAEVIIARNNNNNNNNTVDGPPPPLSECHPPLPDILFFFFFFLQKPTALALID